MAQLISHYAQAAIVFVTVFLIFALLFAVFPKEAWTDAYRAGEGSAAAAEGGASGSVGNAASSGSGSGAAPSGSGGGAASSGSAGGEAPSSSSGSLGGAASSGASGADAASPLSGMHAAKQAPKPGISDTTVIVGQPVGLTDLITADGRRLSASGSRYTVTLHEALWLEEDGSLPEGSPVAEPDTGGMPAAADTESGSVICTGSQVTFRYPGIYRIRITVGETSGFTTTAYLYCHAARKGFA